ncbi:probable terpene synthase 2 isoform X2 [Vicia villosa]|uniref:probable terpene synthase 2 isoform X2 n=1 Tax=Vicia villosa TaxID=3911 RepID=UPI00273C74A4|nr:probable terpene synthase 2 isoform X2 [Vicia villosa]
MSSVTSSTHLDAKSDLQRNLADFHPNVWGEYFLQYASESIEFDQNIGAQIETLKDEVRKMLLSKIENQLLKVNLIDSICRLGVSYHFEHEIDEVLQHIHKTCVENEEIILEDNLHSIAVLFRVLRQQGFRVSSNVFTKFKDEQGNFRENLVTDVEGMLSLYEASHMMIHGEDILEGAMTFTSTNLEFIATQLNPSLAAQVKYTLKQALHKNLPRLEARRYINIYEQNPLHSEILLTLAKLDFNMLQTLHQKEFGNICMWWIGMDVPRKFSFARDRIVECCFWILTVYYEPQFSQARKIMTKLIAMLSIIDDTFDAYGTIDELELFAKTIERWDVKNLDDLPEYMKLIYKMVLKNLEEIEQDMTKEGRLFTLKYYIKEFQMTVDAFMTEARWFNNNYVPTIEEYLNISKISSAQSLLITCSYIGMGDIATENIFKWVSDKPKMVNAVATLCRLMDEIVSSEFEHKRGHVCSLLDCIMKQNEMSREAAIEECRERIVNTWKDINEECLKPTEVPMPFLTRAINLSRFMDVFYKDKDNYTHSEGSMKSYIKLVLVDPIPI